MAFFKNVCRRTIIYKNCHYYEIDFDMNLWNKKEKNKSQLKTVTDISSDKT